jgi:hypothetical protein
LNGRTPDKPFPFHQIVTPTGGITQDKKMLKTRHILIYSLLMTAIVVASNVLVQYPLSGQLAGIALGDILTYGAFTYPVAFLVTDLTNRQFGPKTARKVVFIAKSSASRRRSDLTPRTPSRPERPISPASCSTSRYSTGCASSPGGRRHCSVRSSARCSTRSSSFRSPSRRSSP